MKKLVLILIVVVSIVYLTRCGGYSENYYNEDVKEQVVDSITEPILLDTILYQEIPDENLIVTITEESKPQMEIAIKDETASVKIDTLQTLSEAELEKRRIEEEFKQIEELRAKKEEGERLKVKEEIQLQEYHYNIRKQSVEEKIDRLDAQQQKLDSLIREKEKK